MSQPFPIGNLAVYAEESAENVRLLPTSTRYRILEACIDLGLSLLESYEGRRSLVQVATEIVGGRVATKKSHIYRDDLVRMDFWIDRFLSSMRSSFPQVLITPRAEGEAEAERYDWEGTMEEYDAGLAGILYVNSVLVSNMVNARQQQRGDAYDIFKFQMAVTIAHELVHFLTGYLSGTAKPNTPPKVNLVPYGNRLVGEAGRRWEKILFGGVLEFWSRETDALGDRQAGVPYLFEDGRRGTQGQLISLNYAIEFTAKRFTFPMRASSGSTPVTRNSLSKSGSEETTTMRQSRAMRRQPRIESPRDPSSPIAYRRLPPGHFYPGESSQSSYRR